MSSGELGGKGTGRRRETQPEDGKKLARSGRQRLMIGYGTAGLLGLATLIAIIALAGDTNHHGDAHINQATGSTNGIRPDTRAGTDAPHLKIVDLKKAAKLAECELRLHLKDEGHKHIPPTAPTPNYRTSPATSGNHVEEPFQQADGAYSQTPQEINVVHSLEHGRLAIQYRPDLSESDQLELIGVYGTIWGGTIIFPNRNMPYDVAATTWTNLLGCHAYEGSITLDAIRDFGKVTWGRYGGEPVNMLGATAPTPIEPVVKK